MTINGRHIETFDRVFILFLSELFRGADKDRDFTLSIAVNGVEQSTDTIERIFKEAHTLFTQETRIALAAEITQRADGLHKGQGGILETDLPAYIRQFFAEILYNISDTFLNGSVTEIKKAVDGCYIVQFERFVNDGLGGAMPITENSVILIRTENNIRTVHSFDKKFNFGDFMIAYPGIQLIARVL